MTEDFEISPGKSIGDLGQEALWFFLHSVFAVLIMMFTVGIMTLFHPDPDAAAPKEIATLLIVFITFLSGFLIARFQGNDIARYVWITGVILFAAVCVWVIDLPTGPGLCNDCTTGHIIEKLYRTFFSISNGSGLVAGWGLFIGTWTPLALIMYAVGANYGLKSED
jgi:hypothetical protein